MGFNHQQPVLLLSLQETAAHDEKFNLSSIYLDVEIGKSSSMSDDYQHLEIICTRELNKFSLSTDWEFLTSQSLEYSPQFTVTWLVVHSH